MMDDMIDYDLEINPTEGLEAESIRVERMYKEDSVRACELMGNKLASWNRYVQVLEHGGYRYGAPGLDPSEPDVLPELWREQERGVGPAAPDFHLKDERPYFRDPIPLGFDPVEVCRHDDGKGEEGVPFAKIWVDTLARTLWLAIKARHLTSQYFRQACLDQAGWIRNNPPRTVDELSLTTGADVFRGLAYYFRVQIYPYIVKILIDEQRWPWFRPAEMAKHDLGWSAPPPTRFSLHSSPEHSTDVDDGRPGLSEGVKR